MTLVIPTGFNYCFFHFYEINVKLSTQLRFPKKINSITFNFWEFRPVCKKIVNFIACTTRFSIHR